MKTFLLCLFAMLAVLGRVSAQTPTPGATPNDVPAPTPAVATPAPTCPMCGTGKGEDGDQHRKPAKTPDDDVATLTQLETDWANALVHNDVPALERMVADEYTSVSPDGSVAYKTEHIAAAKAVAGKIESFRFSDIQVRVYGGTAVVMGDGLIHWTTNQIDGFQVPAAPFRWMDVFVKRDGRWQAVASQSTSVTQAASGLSKFFPPGT